MQALLKKQHNAHAHQNSELAASAKGLPHQDHVVVEFGSHSQPQETSLSVTQVDSPQTIVTGTGNACSQPHPVIDMVWPSRGTTRSASQVVSPQEGGAPRENIDGTMACLMDCIEALKKENGSVISTISMHVDKYLKANVLAEDQISVPELYGDDNMVVDSLSPGMISNLRESAEKMLSDGFEKECLHVYSNWRREFLRESLCTLGLPDQELNMEDINNMEKIESLIKAMNIAARILFPNERRFFNLVFSGSLSSCEFHFRELCTEWAISLLNSALVLATWSHFMRNTLLELIQEFELCTTPGNIVVLLIRQTLYIYEALDDVSLIPGGGIDPITFEVMYYIYFVSKSREMSKLSQDLKEEKISSPVDRANTVRMLVDNILEAKSKNGNRLELSYYIKSLSQSGQSKLRQGLEDEILYVYRMIELLESSLEANSKNYKNPTLGYVFIMNNRRFIGVEAKLNELGPIFADDWLHKNTTIFQKNLELYLRSSWNKIVNLLKLDINQQEPSVAAELMKDKLFWFNEHFYETCNIQSEWSVCDEELREQIIKSIENILLPAYGNFIGRFEKFLGKNAYKYIKYGIGEVQDQLKNLFLIRE